MRPFHAVVVAALSLLTTACAGTAAPANGEPELGVIHQVGVATDVTLPLDAYRVTRQHASTLARARDILFRQCMAGFGFNIPASPAGGDGELDPGRRYGISDPAEVAQYGYHLPPNRQGGRNSPDGGGRLASDAESTVASGRGLANINGRQVPEGGCTAEADRGLGLTVNASPESNIAQDLIQPMDNEAHNQYLNDSRVKAADKAWSECMRGHGHDYDSWRDANNDPRWGNGETPTQEEITVAKADVECKHQTNLAGISLAVESAYQRRLIAAKSEAMGEQLRQVDEMIRRATAVVGRG